MINNDEFIEYVHYKFRCAHPGNVYQLLEAISTLHALSDDAKVEFIDGWRSPEMIVQIGKFYTKREIAVRSVEPDVVCMEACSVVGEAISLYRRECI